MELFQQLIKFFYKKTRYLLADSDGQMCLAVHRFDATKEVHKILFSQHGKQPDNYNLCDKHNGEIKERFCFDHDIIICGKCFTEHKKCHVKEVSDACKSFNMSAEKTSFCAEVCLLLNRVKESSQSIKSNKARLEKKKHDILTEAQEQREELLEKVHQSHQDFSGEVTSLFKHHTTYLSARQSALDKIGTKVDTILQSLQQKGPKKQHDQRDFLELHYYAEKVRLCENEIKMLSLKHINVSHTYNTNIQPLKLTKDRFGRLSFLTTTFKHSAELPSIHYPYKGPRYDPHKTVPGIGAMRGHPVQTMKLTPLDKINVKISDDKNSCCITGIGITVDGNMMLADEDNCKIKLISPDGTLLSSLKPAEKPIGVAVINKSKAAVSMEKNR